ncbi:MAG TPA: SDR family oxidoreductase [Gammaproteobacteria bacterium]|nr:SDR family oxidoreductase [Gammaproteobacteria bacterium]
MSYSTMPASGNPLSPEGFTMEDFNQVLMTNLGSCFLGLKYVTPVMKKQGSGSIINGSTAGVTTDGSGPLYSASKAGVIHMTKVWVTQLAEFGVGVNCISPGAIVTPIFWGGHQTQSAEENERRNNGSPCTTMRLPRTLPR